MSIRWALIVAYTKYAQCMHNDIIKEWPTALIIEWLWLSNGSDRELFWQRDPCGLWRKWQTLQVTTWLTMWLEFLFTAYKVWGSMARLAALCHSRDAASSLCGCSSSSRLAPDKQTAQFWCLLVLSALRARSTFHTYSVQRWAYYHVNISPRLPRVCVWLVALRGVVMPRYYWCIYTFILVYSKRIWHAVIPKQSFRHKAMTKCAQDVCKKKQHLLK